MQKGMVAYKLLGLGWDLSEHLGEGYDFLGEKYGEVIKVSIKAIDLNAVPSAKKVTRHVTADEINCSTHLIITLFNDVNVQASYIMTMRQFIERYEIQENRKSRVYDDFFAVYLRPMVRKFQLFRKFNSKKNPLEFTLHCKPNKEVQWRLEVFREQWNNLDIHHSIQDNSTNLLPYSQN